ncbi:hypothetical protein GGX14DRAFT_484661 [Mycena pura]|uniref:Uncharacterized protein n=1 Tax=Mycena pura TaxID=153505 RepID=A0AAD6Y117_9AGAR|nr:hypothetical protein GGX14DRAFT_484661 [Mycena pura]
MDTISPTTASSDLDTIHPLASSASSNYSLTPSAAPAAQALIWEMKAKLGALDQSLGALHGQTVQIALLGGEPQIAEEIENLRNQLWDQDRMHKEGIQEIKLLLDHVLQNDVVELLKKQAEDDIAGEIDRIVEEQVAICLKSHIPQELQAEVKEQETILEVVRRDLHNSESRRTNAMLRSSHEDDSLQVIYKADGTVPDKYPPTLKALFEMDVETSKELMKEYELPDCSNTRERNLNRLLQFFGVRYQMVREGAATRSVGLA